MKNKGSYDYFIFLRKSKKWKIKELWLFLKPMSFFMPKFKSPMKTTSATGYGGGVNPPMQKG